MGTFVNMVNVLRVARWLINNLFNQFFKCFFSVHKCSTQNRLRSHFPYGVNSFSLPALCSGFSTPSHLLPSIFSLQTGQFISLFLIISSLCVAAQSCLLSSTAILGMWHFISAVFSFIWASKGPMSLLRWVSLLFHLSWQKHELLRFSKHLSEMNLSACCSESRVTAWTTETSENSTGEI